MRARALIFFFGIAGAALHARAEIEFTGVLSATGSVKFALRDTTTGAAHWIGLGGMFEDYTVSSYDSKNDTIVLTKNSVPLRIRLNTAKVHDGVAATAPLTLSQAKTIYGNLRNLSAWADQYYLQTGKKSVTLDELLAAKIALSIKPVAGEDYSAMRLDPKNLVYSVKTSAGETITLDLQHNDAGQATTSTFHTIKSGETLFLIARAAGTTPQRLAQLNELTDLSRLSAGELLRIH